ncbi:MAG: glycosyltransferase family 2 protein [bacterium]|nr:glycosyltransferase family 2 protein [bacterium]
MKKNTLTVTIGIPAYNEERNIESLLKILLSQKEKGFTLRNIIVVSDASTDRTAEIVKSIKNKRVVLVVNKNRLGQNVSQNIIFSMVKTDVVVLFEADTRPSNNSYLSRLLSPLRTSKDVGFAYGNIEPIGSKSLVGRVIDTQFLIYHNVLLRQRGPSFFTSGRSGRAFMSIVYKRLRWPADVPEDAYAHFWCKNNAVRIAFSSGAVTYFKTPQTKRDFFVAYHKINTARTALMKHFPAALLRSHFKRDLVFSLTILMSFILSSPLYFVMYGYLQILLLVGRKNFGIHYPKKWPSMTSTKTLSPEFSVNTGGTP